MGLYLYKVTASETDYDCFSEAVVYASSASDAMALVREVCASGADKPTGAGAWFSILDTAVLRAKRVSVRRGPVMGYGPQG